MKSGNVVTVMQGVTLGCEALPPYIMYKSMAELPKASLEFMACLPQILGQYGFPEKRFFDVPYTGNKPGGMNNMAHHLWHQHIQHIILTPLMCLVNVSSPSLTPVLAASIVAILWSAALMDSIVSRAFLMEPRLVQRWTNCLVTTKPLSTAIWTL